MNIFKKTNNKGLTFFDYLYPHEAECVKSLVVKNYKLKKVFQQTYQRIIVWKKRHPRGKELDYATAHLYAGRIDRRLYDLGLDHDSRDITTAAFSFWTLGYSRDILNCWFKNCRMTKRLFCFEK